MRQSYSPELLTFEEYRNAAGVSTRTLRRWLSYDELPGSHQIDGRWRIPQGVARTLNTTAPKGAGRTTARALIPTWTIADRLRKARESAGLEQNEPALAAGISRATISNSERGVGVLTAPQSGSGQRPAVSAQRGSSGGVAEVSPTRLGGRYALDHDC